MWKYYGKRNSKSKSKTKRSKPARKTKNYSKKASLSKAQIARIAKSVFQRQAEKKIVVSSFSLTPRSLQNTSTGTTAGNYWILNPSSSAFGYDILNGTGSDERIGNKVQMSSCCLNLSIIPTQYNATTNPFLAPQYVIMYIYKYKQIGNIDPPLQNLAGGTADLFQPSGS